VAGLDASNDLALLEAGLKRTADALGDITPRVMRLLYQRHAEAPATFKGFRANGLRQSLEGEMVAQTLHCIMQWLQDPMEVESIFWGTVPHHVETLKVSTSLFCGLFEAVCDTIIATIPLERDHEAELWARLRSDIAALIIRYAKSVRA
jgi:hypothetical protein